MKNEWIGSIIDRQTAYDPAAVICRWDVCGSETGEYTGERNSVLLPIH
jgi:hypothetical protein